MQHNKAKPKCWLFNAHIDLPEKVVRPKQILLDQGSYDPVKVGPTPILALHNL